MIEVNNTEVFGINAAIRGMRNPMNSWDKSDSTFNSKMSMLGMNDKKLMLDLISAGTDHSKFMRMITVQADITAPLYWWKEFDTYKVSTVRNSCSTMHKITAKEFEWCDFSHEYITNSLMVHSFDAIITVLNDLRDAYLESKDKKLWYNIIQFLPSSYNQKATVQLNYQTLRNMYHSRKEHKLKEWHQFCDWIKTLPYSDLITCD